MNRTEARNIVMTILYQIFMYQANNIDYNKDEVIKENLPVDNDFVKLMVNGVLDKKNELFDIANKYLKDWKISRLGFTDQAILSMGIYEEGVEKGIDQGIEKGIIVGVEKTAVNMLKKSMDIATIIEVTGLSEEKIDELKSKL